MFAPPKRAQEDRQTHKHTQIQWLCLGRWAPGLVWKGVTSEKHVVPAWWAICLIKRPLSQSIRLSARELCAARPQFPPLCLCLRSSAGDILGYVYTEYQMGGFLLKLYTNKPGSHFGGGIWRMCICMSNVSFWVQVCMNLTVGVFLACLPWKSILDQKHISVFAWLLLTDATMENKGKKRGKTKKKNIIHQKCLNPGELRLLFTSLWKWLYMLFLFHCLFSS